MVGCGKDAVEIRDGAHTDEEADEEHCWTISEDV